jgi:hypothetical protein
MRSVSSIKWVFPLGLLCLFNLGCSSTGGSSVRLASPSTFVAAWVAPGGDVTTMESVDALNWRFRTVQASTLSRTSGPAVAHDGGVTWMLMWVNGPELQYKTGLGGSTGSNGITWEQQPVTGRLAVSPADSPALAFGVGRWVAVFRRSTSGLFIVRSDVGSALSWSPAAPLLLSGGQPALSGRAPALTAGNVNGNNLFVVSFLQGGNAVAATSPDGVNWSAPTPIAIAEKDPSLSFQDGRFYAVLSRAVGGGYTNFVFTSPDGNNWTQVASFPRGALNATGPAGAFGNCTFLVAEAFPSSNNAIGSRIGTTHVDQCAPPRSLDFTLDIPLTEIGGGTERVGNSGARMAIGFGHGTQDIEAIDPVLTQSGLIDRMRPPSELVAGKNTLLRARLKAKDAAQSPTSIDSATLTIVDVLSGQTVTSVTGTTIGADNVTQVATLQDGDDLLFFIPGAMVAADMTTRFDLTLTKGSDTLGRRGVMDNVVFRSNGGIPIATDSYDQGPSSGEVAATFADFTRAYPIVDSVGNIGSQAGVRFQHTTGLPLPAIGGLGEYESEFVLPNIRIGTGADGANVNCAADVPNQLFPSRVLAFNFTYPEDLNGNGMFDGPELDKCRGDDMSERFINMVGRFHSDTGSVRENLGQAFPADRPKFGITFVEGPGPRQQNVTGLGGQCPAGLDHERLCWITVADYPVLHHEMGHAFGLAHDDPMTTIPGPAYDLLNRRRVMTPRPIMLPNVFSPAADNFFLDREYDSIARTLRSSGYISLASRELSPLPRSGAAFGLAAGASVKRTALAIDGRLLPGPKLKVITTRVIETTTPDRGGRNDLHVRLLDAAGKELASTNVTVTRDDEVADQPAGHGGSFFSALLPFPPNTATVAFDADSKEIHRLRVPSHPPAVHFTVTSGDVTQGRTLRWSGADPDGQLLTYDVALVRPDGRLTLLARDARATTLSLDPKRVGGGRGMVLRVSANDGFHTSIDELGGIDLPNQQPEVSIVYPATGSHFSANGKVVLRAVATDVEDGLIPRDRIQWVTVEGEDLGRGDVITAGLKPGAHTIRAIATDSDGSTGQAEVQVIVGGR